MTESFHPRMDGVVRTVSELLEYLAREGHEAVLFAPGAGPTEWAGFPVIRVEGVKMPLYPDLTLSPYGPHLRSQLQLFRPDIVHLASPALLGWYAAHIANEEGYTVAAHYQTDLPGYARSYGGRPLRRVATPIRTVMERAEANRHNSCAITYAPNDAFAAELRARGIQRVAVSGRGVDTTLFRPGRPGAARAAERWPAGDGARILCVARLAKEKELEMLFAAARESPQHRFLLVGDGPLAAELRRSAPPNVALAGALVGDELADTYAAADLFAFPSGTETFGQVVQEALASGIPVVGRDSGGVAGIVRQGETGLLTDAAGFGATVANMANDLPRAHRMGAQGHREMQSRTWSSIFRELVDGDYARIVAEHDGAPYPVTRPADPVATSTVCVIGGGYVGLVTAAVLAERGNAVRVLDVDAASVETINAGRSPVHEPGLSELISEHRSSGRLTATIDPTEAMTGAQTIVVAVGTPAGTLGEADLSAVRSAVDAAARHAESGAVVAIKSTVPPGTTQLLEAYLRERGSVIPLVACPEFLQEGRAVQDMRRPSRVVVGSTDHEAAVRVSQLFAGNDTPVHLVSPASAELIKNGSNAFLATKISFANSLAQLCEAVGADVTEVTAGIGDDPRIGRAFLGAGAGWGGSCFPKDSAALEAVARRHGLELPIVAAARMVNDAQRDTIANTVAKAVGGSLTGKRIAVLGLAFKAGTDDVRESPAFGIITKLELAGALVTATDPVALANAERSAYASPRTTFVANPYECLRGADAVIITTDWPEYTRDLHWGLASELMACAVVVDARNALDGTLLNREGYDYWSVGRRPLLVRPGQEGPVRGAVPGPVERRATDAFVHVPPSDPPATAL